MTYYVVYSVAHGRFEDNMEKMIGVTTDKKVAWKVAKKEFLKISYLDPDQAENLKDFKTPDGYADDENFVYVTKTKELR